jgi:hypothetical protein
MAIIHADTGKKAHPLRVHEALAAWAIRPEDWGGGG